jgi:hypothetical protein
MWHVKYINYSTINYYRTREVDGSLLLVYDNIVFEDPAMLSPYMCDHRSQRLQVVLTW